MKIFEYVPLMKELDTPFTTAGLVILIAFLAIVLLKMLGGLRRGGWRQLIRTGMTVVAAVAAYMAGCWLSNHVIGMLNLESIQGLIDTIESAAPGTGEMILEVLAIIDTEMVEYTLLLPATVIFIPLFTTMLFLAINLVLKLVRAIITKILGLEKAQSNSQRLCGALLAAVEGVVWIMMVMLPFCGTLSLVDQAYDKAIVYADEETKNELEAFYDEYLMPFTTNPAIEFIDYIGINTIADGIATVEIDNKKTNIRDEIISVSDIIWVDSRELQGADFANLTSENKESISSIVDAFADSPFMSHILIRVIHVVPGLYDLQLLPIDLGPEINGFVDSFMSFFRTISADTFKEDLNTIKDFYFGFSDSGLIAAIAEGQDIMQFVSDDYRNDKNILGMLNTLSGNVRTQPIVDGIYNIVLNLAFSGSNGGSGENGDNGSAEVPTINITEVKDGLNNIVSVTSKKDELPEAEYKEELANTIQTTINDTINVELEDEVVEDIADYVDQNFSDQLGELTDEEFNELIFEFIDIYQSYLNGDDINPDDFNDMLQ